MSFRTYEGAMKVLYVGELIGGAANYLMGILRSMRADVTHVSSNETLRARPLERKHDVIIISDFPRAQAPDSSLELVADQVSRGAGLMMVGGWASFSGPFGGWSGSAVEKLLPVKCIDRDDRTNFPAGAWIVQSRRHPMFGTVPFTDPPVICGMNRVIPRRGSTVLLSAKKIVKNGSRGGLSLDRTEHPLLVIDSDQKRRVAAFTSDFAPHWCGGLVDWGGRHQKLKVNDKIHIEVGRLYIRFVSSLVRWLAG